LPEQITGTYLGGYPLLATLFGNRQSGLIGIVEVVMCWWFCNKGGANYGKTIQ